VKWLGRVRRAATFGLAAGLVVGLVAGLAALLPAPLAVAISVGLLTAVVVGSAVRVEERVLGSIAGLEKPLRKLPPAIDRLTVQNAEVASIAAMSAVDVPYPLPLGGKWALGWDGAAVLAREVATTRPGTVVELGSGASSLVIGMQLRRIGRGHLLTLDHEPDFAAITRRHVVALGLEPWVTVLDAPLTSCRIDEQVFEWYALPEAVTALDHIDLLVVDGPPQKTDPEGTPRYPAIPMLGVRLGPRSAVFLDDANRGAEQRMLERWLHEEPSWTLETIDTKHGTAILRWTE
jgi:xanthosine utilization system XapX-like protein